jgi:hypothetical protein
VHGWSLGFTGNDKKNIYDTFVFYLSNVTYFTLISKLIIIPVSLYYRIANNGAYDEAG